MSEWRDMRTLGFWSYIFHRFFYRAVSRILHRFDLHYAPLMPPMMPYDGMRVRWCKWCGMRDSFPVDPYAEIRAAAAEQKRDEALAMVTTRQAGRKE